ncbi:MAG TPA: glutamate synthase large subunit [Candidatus Binataceae bacterium]|jgi:glutamate synthase (NADPH/NADH) large chain|nr:glutamate synthase large subunit [Candidatus Binataceae bacterium]
MHQLRKLPSQQGLYQPGFEHDACGVGFVVNIKGEKSHDIVRNGLQVLDNLTHRGACGCDPLTGDGAGILLQIPDAFFRTEVEKLDFGLPAAGSYAVGSVFLPLRGDERDVCEQIFERVVREEGQHFLGWREVPVVESACGYIARRAMPAVRQVFIGRSSEIEASATEAEATDAFERKLYVIRRRVENEIRALDLAERDLFYVCSLSSLTIVYKGQLISTQIPQFYPDLLDPALTSALAMVHQRFSTNTFPSWDRAHPYRFLCHNGEINTLRGNINWMRAREKLFSSPLFGDDIKKLVPIIQPTGSDSAMFDNALELLVRTGRSLAHAVMMMIPEAWQNHESMSDAKRAFYEFHSCMMEPWDGPASIAFTDGRQIGAVLDRNGLRPSRYLVTKGGLVVMASETGVLDIPPQEVALKGRLQPGRMFLVDTVEGRIVGDEEIKEGMAARKPYRQWLKENLIGLADLPKLPTGVSLNGHGPADLLDEQQAFGYTIEELKMLVAPMALNGQEAVGSMGNDAPLAVLSDHAPLLFNYFKQLFAQVTNPPVDPIREELVMSAETTIGGEQNLFEESPLHCRQLRLKEPILSNAEMEKIKRLALPGLRSTTLSMLYRPTDGAAGLRAALDKLCESACKAIADGNTIIILSDRGVDADHMAIPSLLATGAVHHHLVREGTRTRAGLVVESGEPREVMHFCLLMGYGASAFNPYLVYATLGGMIRDGILKGVTEEEATHNFAKAVTKGLIKTASKMGISTLQSYRGAQIFEAVGLNRDVIDRYFTWTPSRVEGIGLDVIHAEALKRHDYAFKFSPELDGNLDLGGQYQWRRSGEFHMYNPNTIAKLQHSVRAGSYRLFKDYTREVDEIATRRATLRGLLKFKPRHDPVPIEEVEPASEIVKRFKTGAMSFGSISKEAHENLAIAMNRLGGKSNTGEGGEDPARFARDPNGDWRRSAIKQVASGRFGVTSNYLVNADELQIKMAQGAKPGEGGQLPGHKVDDFIAKIRYSTPGVGLISPPPHHDIYSIEDLAQLIHDLKNSNDRARISVKLVAEVGVGTIAAGVSKAKADVVLISGHDGGTGASPWSSIKHAGAPWELGLAETQQTLVLNDLRGRIRVETDGQLKTGRDVAMAALLGADEFGFATAALVASGCIMMRVCHLNTCPVGIATQDPVLRAKFEGKPEHVVNFMMFIAQELREYMAQLGFRKLDDMIGHVECLDADGAVEHWKARHIDLSALLHKPDVGPEVALHCVEPQDHGLEKALDRQFVELCKDALEHKKPVEIHLPVRNINRTAGTILSSEVSRRWGEEGLPPYTIQIHLRGSGGQSFGAFLARGVALYLEGDANDYCGKGLSGGLIAVHPPREATFKAEENIVIGNVALYGATAGEAFFRGMAGERFAVRNSGAAAVVEGVGDHGCEYMTRGIVIVLGKTGRNFAAGMSGGVAFVLDEDRTFPGRCNTNAVELVGFKDEAETRQVHTLITRHYQYTQSEVARRLLDNWDDYVGKFVKVLPSEYRKILERQHLDTESMKLASV